MHNLLRSGALSVWLGFLCCTSCGGDTKTEKESTVSPYAQTDLPTEVGDRFPALEPYPTQLKEALFFHLRSRFREAGNGIPIRSESFQLANNEVHYLLTTYASPLYDGEEESEHTAIGDSIVVHGQISLSQEQFKGLNEEKGDFEVHFEGTWTQTTLSYTPYSEPQREQLSDVLTDDITIGRQARAYAKHELYLKARLHALSTDDLKDHTQEELAYLRNEIFARHGHRFKTDKMKTYFGQQTWYSPYTKDATPLLNDTEKHNAQFIKTLEKEG